MNKYEVAMQNEGMFLGCILSDPTLLDESVLSPEQLSYPPHREIYKDMMELSKEGKEISVFGLAQLGESRTMQYGGMDYLNDLIQSVPSIHGFKTYQQSIVNFHTVYKAQQAVNNFMESTREVHDIKELSKLIRNVTELEGLTVSNNLTFKQKLLERVQQHFDSPESGLSGVNTGYMNLNKMTDGWQKTDLIIVAARPSVGKTAFVLNSILNGLKKEKDIFATFFSIEMADGPVIDRLIASEANINLMKMRNPNKSFTPEEWNRHSHAVGLIEKLNFDIKRENTVPEIRAAIRRNIKEHPDKKHIVAIDFLTLIKHISPSGNNHQDVSDIVRDLKGIAVEFNIPMIVISQLNRGVESRQDKRPNMSDLTESGTIEQIADVVALMYREDYYDKDKKENNNIVEINFAKNRQGIVDRVKMRFQKETNTFYDIDYR